MNARIAWCCALLCALFAAGAGTWGWREHQRAGALDFAARRSALLEEENERLHGVLAEQEKSGARAGEDAKRKEIEAAVVDIRGLDFKQPVVYAVLPHAGFRNILENKMSEQYSDQDFKNAEAGLAALGLLEPGYNLKEKYISLLGEQIAAFYDQHQHKLFMFEDASLSKMQNCIVLAHELTHALQDQHFNLLAMPLEVKDNDDLALATSALIEGDATVVMTDYTMKNFTLKMLRENLAGMYSQNMDQLKNAPRYLREALMFPYLRGQEFCNVLVEQGGGYEAITAAFKNPPVSTTQILHPEKYFAHEMPVRVEWPDRAVLGRQPVDDNVLGEFGIRVLFSQWLDDATGKAAALGWRGDRYLVFDDGAGMVWKTVWENPQQAAAFRAALQRYVAARFKQCTMGAADARKTQFTAAPCSGEIIDAKTPNGIILIWAANEELKNALLQKFSE